MRLLFVSGTTGGGSGRSQRELAKQLILRGNEVTFIVDDKRAAPFLRWVYARLSDLSVRLLDRPGGDVVARARDRVGRQTRALTIDGLEHQTSPVPQNAAAHFLITHATDVVVVNSIERWAWRRIHAACSARGQATILYVREEDSLGHLDAGAVPDVLVANAASLAERLRRKGYSCEFLPSVIDTEVTRTHSSRLVALTINPIPEKGADLIWALADELPDVNFVVQESWPLTGSLERAVKAEVAARPNLELRRRTPPGPQLYGDARVVLVPYRMDSRPRVILEAQANGIPVIVADVPALQEAVGDGGVSVPLHSTAGWVSAIRTLWDDDRAYQILSHTALSHSQRPDVDPAEVARTFEVLVHRAASPERA